MNWSMIDLGAVDEVAELRLPDDQRRGSALRVAVLEAEHGRLAQQAVDELDRRLLAAPRWFSGTYGVAGLRRRTARRGGG